MATPRNAVKTFHVKILKAFTSYKWISYLEPEHFTFHNLGLCLLERTLFLTFYFFGNFCKFDESPSALVKLVNLKQNQFVHRERFS